MTSPKDRIIDLLQRARNQGMVLDVSNIKQDATGLRLTYAPRTERSSKKQIGDLPLVSNNYYTYQYAINLLGPQYSHYSQQYLKQYPPRDTPLIQRSYNNVVPQPTAPTFLTPNNTVVSIPQPNGLVTQRIIQVPKPAKTIYPLMQVIQPQYNYNPTGTSASQRGLGPLIEQFPMSPNVKLIPTSKIDTTIRSPTKIKQAIIDIPGATKSQCIINIPVKTTDIATLPSVPLPVVQRSPQSTQSTQVATRLSLSPQRIPSPIGVQANTQSPQRIPSPIGIQANTQSPQRIQSQQQVTLPIRVPSSQSQITSQQQITSPSSRTQLPQQQVTTTSPIGIQGQERIRSSFRRQGADLIEAGHTPLGTYVFSPATLEAVSPLTTNPNQVQQMRTTQRL